MLMTFSQAFSQKGILGCPYREKWTPLDNQIPGEKGNDFQ
jgi:hypothetical protein